MNRNFDYIKENLALIYMSLVFALASIALCGCSPVREAVVEYRDVYRDVLKIDSVRLHDSIYVHIYEKGDTVWQEKYVERWRDRWRERVDTVSVTDTIRQDVVKLEKYVPAFYKGSTWMCWIMIVSVIVYIAWKIWRKMRP